jgi:putative ABC transport system permease protein
LLVRSMVRLQAIDPGWTSDGMTVFTVALPAIRYPQPADVVRAFEQLDEQFSAIPGVESVARINGLPLGTNVTVLSFARADRPAPLPGQEPSALFRAIDTEYLRTAGIALLAGRDFDARDRQGAPPVAIVSRELADELWRGEDPIGKHIAFTKTRRTIVGVAEGVRSTNIQAPPQPEMYVPHAQTANRAVMFVIKSSLPASQVIVSSRNIVRAVDSRLPLIQPRAFAEIEANALAGPRFYLVLLTLFAVLAVALAAVGIYGVVAYTVTQRTREIGVRMALGAEAREVLRLVMWQGLKPAALGIVLGALGAFAGGRVMTRLLYEVQPRDPLTMTAAMVTLLLVVCTACAVPAYRATRILPAVALRGE